MCFFFLLCNILFHTPQLYHQPVNFVDCFIRKQILFTGEIKSRFLLVFIFTGALSPTRKEKLEIDYLPENGSVDSMN